MWWLAIPIAAGAVAAIWGIFNQDARDARTRWESEKDRLQQEVERHRQNIEQNLAKAETSYSFQLLQDLHYSSVRVADHAYSALRDAFKSLDTMGLMLVEAKTKRGEAYARLRSASGHSERHQIQQEIELINDLRATVFPDKDAVKAQKNSLLAEVKRLNEQTRKLKVAIRDRCGAKGRDWFNRLEARTARRRGSSR